MRRSTLLMSIWVLALIVVLGRLAGRDQPDSQAMPHLNADAHGVHMIRAAIESYAGANGGRYPRRVEDFRPGLPDGRLLANSVTGERSEPRDRSALSLDLPEGAVVYVPLMIDSIAVDYDLEQVENGVAVRLESTAESR